MYQENNVFELRRIRNRVLCECRKTKSAANCRIKNFFGHYRGRKIKCENVVSYFEVAEKISKRLRIKFIHTKNANLLMYYYGRTNNKSNYQFQC